jgi:hypothetical protein
MTPSNFNWFIHVMLFYHTRNVVNKQINKARKRGAGNVNDDDSNSDDDRNNNDDHGNSDNDAE